MYGSVYFFVCLFKSFEQVYTALNQLYEYPYLGTGSDRKSVLGVRRTAGVAMRRSEYLVQLCTRIRTKLFST